MSGSNSIANPATVQIANPLEQFSKFATIQNTLNQNDLFNAKRAAGQAFLGASGPNGVDPADLQARLRNDPTSAMAAPETMKQGYDQYGTQYSQHMARLTGLGNVMSTLMAQYHGAVPQEAIDAALQTHAPSLGLTPQEIEQTKAMYGPNPVQNGKVIIQAGIRNLTAQQGLLETLPTKGTYTGTDGSQHGSTQAPGFMGGAVTGSEGGVALGTSPETRAAETPVYQKMPDGTYQQVLQPRSARPGASGAAPRAGAVRDYTGEPNPLLGGLPNPSETASPSLAAPPQGQPERLAEDVKQYSADQAGVSNWNRSVQTLRTAKQALDIANSGPGTASVQQAKAFLKAQGVSLPWMDDEKTTNWAIAHKSLLDYARQAGNAGSSNEQLHAALGSNASTDIDKDAAIHVIQQEIGRNNQNIAGFNEHGDKTGVGYGDHRAKFANTTDPRAFAAGDMTPTQLKTMVAGMGDKERKKFFDSLVIAKRQSHLND